MTSSSPLSPTVQRAALIVTDASTGETRVIRFQFNPDTLTRKLVQTLPFMFKRRKHWRYLFDFTLKTLHCRLDLFTRNSGIITLLLHFTLGIAGAGGGS